MSEKELSTSLDAALAHVDPDRRRFLGMLLAGVAAAPLLKSSSLSAETQTHFPKGGTRLKSDSAIKHDDKHKGASAEHKGEGRPIKHEDKPR